MFQKNTLPLVYLNQKPPQKNAIPTILSKLHSIHSAVGKENKRNTILFIPKKLLVPNKHNTKYMYMYSYPI